MIFTIYRPRWDLVLPSPYNRYVHWYVYQLLRTEGIFFSESLRASVNQAFSQNHQRNIYNIVRVYIYRNFMRE